MMSVTDRQRDRQNRTKKLITIGLHYSSAKSINYSPIPNNFKPIVDGCPVQNRHIFGIWLVHITAAINKLYASFQYTILSGTDNVKILVIVWRWLLH